MKPISVSSLLFLLPLMLVSQERPAWTVRQAIDLPAGSYYGIGVSTSAPEDADIRAFIAFAHSVEIRVRSIFSAEVSEEGKEFSERTSISSELISDVSLKGIGITERYIDTSAGTYYSLIRYRTTEYDSIVTAGIQREILLMKTRNVMEEERKQEELRAERVRHQQEEERTKEELRSRRQQIAFEQEAYRQEEERRTLLRERYREFLSTAVPEKVATMRNGEIAHHTVSFMAKGGIAPLRWNGGYAAMRLAVFEFSATVIPRVGKVHRQEGFAKVQVLPGVGEFSRTSLAVGMSQGLTMIADSGYDFKRSSYSLFIAGNYTDPAWAYTTLSFFGDKRRASAGATTFPFYEQFKTHLGFLLEVNYFFNKEYTDRFGDAVVVNGGIRLQGSDDFSTQFTYENNEEFDLTFEFQL